MISKRIFLIGVFVLLSMYSFVFVSSVDTFLINDSVGNIPFQNIGSQSLVRLDNGGLVAVWKNSDNDGACSISTDNGATWSTSFSEPADVEHLTVATNGTGVYIVAQDTSGEFDTLKYNYSEGGCPSSGWTFQGIPRFVSDEKKPWIEYDGTTDKYVMCYRSGNFYGFAYVNATGGNDWQSTYLNNYFLSTTEGIVINQAPTYGGSCSLSVDTTGDIHICAGLKDTEDSYLQYYKSNDLFSSSIYNKSLGGFVSIGGTSSSVALDDCDINSKDGIVGITFSDDSFISDFFVTYISNDGGETFEQRGIEGNYLNPSICIDESGVAQQFVINYTSSNQSVSYFNFSSSNNYSSEVTLLSSSIGNWSWISPLCHNFPLNNRMKFNSIDFLAFNSNSSELSYSNITFQIDPVCDFSGDKTIMYSVSGNLSYYNSNPMNLSGVNITLLNLDTDESCSVLSNSDGSYYFSGLNSGNWSITPVLNDTSYNVYVNYLDYFYANDSIYGDTTFDLYQNLSCDVSLVVGLNSIDSSNITSYYSSNITSFEVSTSLGSDYSFNPDNLSWGYRNLTSPLNSSNWVLGKITFQSINQSYHGQNFTVLRYGDCWGNNPISIISNSTSPSSVNENDNYKVNLTLSDLDVLDTLYGYVQFYINGVAGFLAQTILTNGTSEIAGTLLGGNFSSGNTLVAEVWAGDGSYNSSKFNLTSVSVVAAPQVSSTPSGGGGGGFSSNQQPNNLVFFIGGVIEMGLVDSIPISLNISNQGNLKLSGIFLNSTFSSEALNVSFEEEFIDALFPGENKTLRLFIDSNSSTEGSYEVYLNANSTSPKASESKLIYVKLVEDLDLGRVVERVALAQDLFRENSQCLELNDLLIQAQRLIDEGRLEEARVIVQEAITKCRSLVTNEEESPFRNGGGFNLRFLIILVIGLGAVALIIGLILRKPSFNLTKARKKRKRGALNFNLPKKW